MARNRAEEDDYEDDDDRPRSRRQRDDEDDRPRRRRAAKKSGGTSTLTILLIVGGVLGAIFLVCGGIGLYAFISVNRVVAQKKQQADKAFQEARTEIERREQIANDNDLGRAKKVVEQWVTFLKQSQFAEAYALTSPNYRGKVTQAEFTALVTPLTGEMTTLAPSVLPQDPFVAKMGNSFGFKLFWTGSYDANFTLKNDNGKWQIDQIVTKLSWFGEIKQKR